MSAKSVDGRVALRRSGAIAIGVFAMALLLFSNASRPIANADEKAGEKTPAGPSATPEDVKGANRDVAKDGKPAGPFEARLLEIAQEYSNYTAANPSYRKAITLCRAPTPSQYADISHSSDAATHGRKLYKLWVKDISAYFAAAGAVPNEMGHGVRSLDSSRPSPVGQALVKETFETVVLKGDEKPSTGDPLERDRPIEVDGRKVRIGARSDLFIMTKLEPATADTDAGWIYGVVSADRARVLAAGRIESCMKCHDSTTRDQLYGPEDTWPKDAAGTPQLPVKNVEHAEVKAGAAKEK